MQTRAHHLDKGFNICGVRFGWSFFIALIPIVGSVADAFLNYYLVIRKARQANIPDWLEAKMILNSSIGVGASFVPLVGDVFLAVWKANSRNAVLLEEYLRVRGEELLKAQREREEREREERERQEQEARDAGVTLSNFTGTTSTAVDTISSGNDKPSFFSFSRWRARPKQEQKQTEFAATDETEQPIDAAEASRTAHTDSDSTSPPPEVIDEVDFPVHPSSAGHESSTGEGSSSKGRSFFSSLSRGKAPPAGEKGRFVEHVPEANYGQWGSLPVQ